MDVCLNRSLLLRFGGCWGTLVQPRQGTPMHQGPSNNRGVPTLYAMFVCRLVVFRVAVVLVAMFLVFVFVIWSRSTASQSRVSHTHTHTTSLIGKLLGTVGLEFRRAFLRTGRALLKTIALGPGGGRSSGSQYPCSLVLV